MLSRLLISLGESPEHGGPETRRSPAIPVAARAAVAAEFPSVDIVAEEGPEDERSVAIDEAAWLSGSFDFGGLGEQMDQLVADGPFTVRLGARCESASRTAIEVLTRYQRLIGRRNRDSSSRLFDCVLAAHATMHDRDMPLVRADHDHALDAWQWVLRLEPDAGLALQVAALFHDIERLATESEVRIEQHATSYQGFKDAHARGGAEIASRALLEAGVGDATRRRVEELIAAHERPLADPDVLLLNDADALSFFSLNSAGYLDYFGPERARHKIAYSLARLRPGARGRLSQIRYRSDVDALVRVALAGVVS